MRAEIRRCRKRQGRGWIVATDFGPVRISTKKEARRVAKEIRRTPRGMYSTHLIALQPSETPKLEFWKELLMPEPLET